MHKMLHSIKDCTLGDNDVLLIHVSGCNTPDAGLCWPLVDECDTTLASTVPHLSDVFLTFQNTDIRLYHVKTTFRQYKDCERYPKF